MSHKYMCPDCNKENNGIHNCTFKDDNWLSPCPKCHCMTKSIRKGRAHYDCGKCGADKSLSDVYFYEATHKSSKENSK